MREAASHDGSHYAPAAEVLSTRKCPILCTRSVRRASGLLETPFTSVMNLDECETADALHGQSAGRSAFRFYAGQKGCSPEAVKCQSGK